MRLFSAMAAEFARAFSVLALVFLSFGHQPVDFGRYGVSAAVTLAVDCGAALSGDPGSRRSTSKKSCEVCRVATVIDLPTPPCPRRARLVALGAETPRPVVTGRPADVFIAGGGPRAPPRGA